MNNSIKDISIDEAIPSEAYIAKSVHNPDNEKTCRFCKNWEWNRVQMIEEYPDIGRCLLHPAYVRYLELSWDHDHCNAFDEIDYRKY